MCSSFLPVSIFFCEGPVSIWEIYKHNTIEKTNHTTDVRWQIKANTSLCLKLSCPIAHHQSRKHIFSYCHVSLPE